MYKSLLAYLIFTSSLFCQAQTSTFLKSYTLSLLLKSINFSTYNNHGINKIPLSNYTFKNRIILSPFNIYHDSLYIKNSRFNPFYNSENITFLMSNKYYYDVNNPLAPHGKCFGCAIVQGSLNYLFLLFEKDK